MSSDIAYDIRTGRLVKDVEIKSIGQAFLITGDIATNRSVKKGESWEDEVSFFTFKMWLKSQKQVDYYTNVLKKGVKVTLDGEIIQEHWKDKEGKNASRYIFNVNRIIPMGVNQGKNENADTTSNVPNNSGSEFPDDLPF